MWLLQYCFCITIISGGIAILSLNYWSRLNCITQMHNFLVELACLTCVGLFLWLCSFVSSVVILVLVVIKDQTNTVRLRWQCSVLKMLSCNAVHKIEQTWWLIRWLYCARSCSVSSFMIPHLLGCHQIEHGDAIYDLALQLIHRNLCRYIFIWKERR